MNVFLLAAAALAAIAAPFPALAAPAPTAAAAAARFSVKVVGTGPDLILIPGLSSSRDVWTATAERLKATRRVHLIQLAGFGEPAGPNASGPVLEPFVTELAAYIKHERLRAPALAGHSMGGLAALMLATDHPGLAGRVLVVDALPFIGTIFGADSVAALRPQAEAMRKMLLAQAATATPDFARTPKCPDALAAPAAPKGTMTNSATGACLVSHGAHVSDLRVVAQAMYDAMVTDLTPRLAGIRAPVTLLYPQDDRLLTAEAAAKVYGDAYATLPGAKLLRIAGSYHFIMQDQPRAFADALDAFLK